MTGGPGWRSVAATWGGAVLLLMRQFGAPPTAGVNAETRVVWIADAEEELVASERTPDGRILTLPVELVSKRERQDAARATASQFTAN